MKSGDDISDKGYSKVDSLPVIKNKENKKTSSNSNPNNKIEDYIGKEVSLNSNINIYFNQS